MEASIAGAPGDGCRSCKNVVAAEAAACSRPGWSLCLRCYRAAPLILLLSRLLRASGLSQRWRFTDSPPFCDQHHCTLNRLALGSVHVFPTTCSSSNHFNIPKSISRHLEIQRRTTGRTRPTPCETSAAGHWFPVAHTGDHTHPESSRNTHSPVIVEHRICVCLRTKGPAT
jgi:hypothetical protein